MKDRSAAISWGSSTGATGYVIEVGSAPGGIDGGVQSAGAATSFTLRDLRAGRSHVRIKARNGSGTSGASAEATFVLPDLADYIEALFLGGGPLIYESNLSCGRRGIWSAFPRGVVDQIPQATAGRLAMWTIIQRPSTRPMMHFDSQVADLDDAVNKAIALGATVARSVGHGGNVVLR